MSYYLCFITGGKSYYCRAKCGSNLATFYRLTIQLLYGGYRVCTLFLTRATFPSVWVRPSYNTETIK